MKQLLAVFLILLFCMSPAWPQKSASQPSSQARLDTASAELATLTIAWTEAINTKDRVKLEALLAPEFALYGWNGGLWAPRSQWLDFINHTRIKEYTVRDISPKLYGDIAIVTSVCTWAGVSNGRPFNSNTILLDTWRRTNGRWQVVARNSCPVNSVSSSPCGR
jgi:hypothetical protein